MRQALWITRFDWEDEAEFTALVSRAIKVGITDLLMQVRGAGDALYRSEVAHEIVPTQENCIVLDGGGIDELVGSLPRGDSVRRPVRQRHGPDEVVTRDSAPVA
jgi:hypothetical protein